MFSSQFILDVKIVGSTSRGHTGFLIHLPSAAVLALIFLVRRIQPFLSLVDREVEFLRTNDLIVLHLLGIYFYLFIYLMWEFFFPGYRHLNSRPNASEGYEPNELPGKKKERKITTENKKRKQKKHLMVVDPETLFMRNSKLIYCPKACIA